VPTRIVTARLVLEALSLEEAAAIRADDRTGRTWASDYPTEGDRVVAAVVGEAGDHYDADSALGPLQIRLGSTGEAVGGVGFLSAPDTDGIVEVGYGLAESAQHRGLATEALAAVLGWAAAHGAAGVEAMTDPDNSASHRVLERCGFDQVGEVMADEGRLLRWLRRLR
jgi:RimJ/RimL family protein N-acetyltransferase